MLKYLALIRVDKPENWGENNCWEHASCFKGPVCENKQEARDWLAKELEKYPDARVNEKKADKRYFIITSILAFDETKSENIKMMIQMLI